MYNYLMEKKQSPQDTWNKNNLLSRIGLPIYSTEKDIYEQLNNQSNKSGYIKKLIREDIKRRNCRPSKSSLNL